MQIIYQGEKKQKNGLHDEQILTELISLDFKFMA